MGVHVSVGLGISVHVGEVGSTIGSHFKRPEAETVVTLRIGSTPDSVVTAPRAITVVLDRIAAALSKIGLAVAMTVVIDVIADSPSNTFPPLVLSATTRVELVIAAELSNKTSAVAATEVELVIADAPLTKNAPAATTVVTDVIEADAMTLGPPAPYSPVPYSKAP